MERNTKYLHAVVKTIRHVQSVCKCRVIISSHVVRVRGDVTREARGMPRRSCAVRCGRAGMCGRRLPRRERGRLTNARNAKNIRFVIQTQLPEVLT